MDKTPHTCMPPFYMALLVLSMAMYGLLDDVVNTPLCKPFPTRVSGIMRDQGYLRYLHS